MRGESMPRTCWDRLPGEGKLRDRPAWIHNDCDRQIDLLKREKQMCENHASRLQARVKELEAELAVHRGALRYAAEALWPSFKTHHGPSCTCNDCREELERGKR